jgi:nucleoside-diphosphate-sugar epimerase
MIDLIITCADHPAAANQTFLVSDDEDLSTTELLQRLSLVLDKSPRLFPVSPALLALGARIFGKKEVAERLLGNLQVDISKTKELLGWAPPYGVDESLRKTAEWYLRHR